MNSIPVIVGGAAKDSKPSVIIGGAEKKIYDGYVMVGGAAKQIYRLNPWSVSSNDYGSGGLMSTPYPATDTDPLVLQVKENSSRRLVAAISYPYILSTTDVVTVDCAMERDEIYHLEWHIVSGAWTQAKNTGRTTLRFTGNIGQLWVGLVRSELNDGYVAYYGKWTIYNIWLNGNKIY